MSFTVTLPESVLLSSVSLLLVSPHCSPFIICFTELPLTSVATFSSLVYFSQEGSVIFAAYYNHTLDFLIPTHTLICLIVL